MATESREDVINNVKLTLVGIAKWDVVKSQYTFSKSLAQVPDIDSKCYVLVDQQLEFFMNRPSQCESAKRSAVTHFGITGLLYCNLSSAGGAIRGGRQQNGRTVSNNESEDLILPGYAINLLLAMLTEMSKGNAITVMPIHAELSTQETAELLNVSRPHLVDLLEQGKIPFRKVGTHRRVLANDVFDYKQRIDEARLKAFDDLATQAQELGMGYE